jgi:pyridoxamine 5'-phosphate oxidase
MDLAQIRSDYARASLDITDVDPDPVIQFDKWMAEALAAKCPEPTAMTLATVDSTGQPAARIVLLKGFDARGFIFYTSYLSRKAVEIAANPKVALLAYWVELERVARIEGRAEFTSASESDAYFARRPLGSRISAAASPQSAPVASRIALDALFREAELRYGDSVARPQHWGGYRVVPDRFEFWQGRRSRRHDRIVYAKNDAGWVIGRLAP